MKDREPITPDISRKSIMVDLLDTVKDYSAEQYIRQFINETSGSGNLKLSGVLRDIMDNPEYAGRKEILLRSAKFHALMHMMELFRQCLSSAALGLLNDAIGSIPEYVPTLYVPNNPMGVAVLDEMENMHIRTGASTPFVNRQTIEVKQPPKKSSRGGIAIP